MTTNNGEIRAQSKPLCEICGTNGETIYRSLRDRLYGATGEWNLKKCSNPNCGLLWLDPMPIEEDIGLAYLNYYTHKDAEVPPTTPLRHFYRRVKAGYLAGKYGYFRGITPFVFRLLGHIFYFHPGRRARLDASVFYLPYQPGGRLLEVGCGNGATLKTMEDLGWNVEGVDFDSKSVRNAKSKGLKVHAGDLLAPKFDDDIFDAVVMSHVIEHVPNPLQVLRECYRILKPGGVLVVLTPNTDSFGHWKYCENWRGLEPPRHLHLFNSTALRHLGFAAGFDDVSCSSTVRAWKVLLNSRILAQKNEAALQKGFSLKMRAWAEMMEFLEGAIRVVFRNAGEELKMTCKKNV